MFNIVKPQIFVKKKIYAKNLGLSAGLTRLSPWAERDNNRELVVKQV
jgi:hypothetical protein